MTGSPDAPPRSGSPAYPTRLLRLPWTIQVTATRIDPIPAVGQQTEAVLSELGYGAPTVASWRSVGVV